MTLEDTENTPLKASMVTESGQAHAYRNRGEDAGNISVAFPKSAIKSGAVRYVGTRAHPSIERAVSTMLGA